MENTKITRKKKKKRSNEVKDIQIYINSDETTPKKALFTAIYINVDKEKKENNTKKSYRGNQFHRRR